MATAFARPGVRFATINFRVNTMNPTSDENLVRFLEGVQKSGDYVLTFALEYNASSLRPALDDAIVKHDLHVRNAWEIGRHDADSIGVVEEDDPIIPATEEAPPVQELIKWKRSLA